MVISNLLTGFSLFSAPELFSKASISIIKFLIFTFVYEHVFLRFFVLPHGLHTFRRENYFMIKALKKALKSFKDIL